MNAAQQLFIDNGVGPTTIEQITAAADVAKGTFYLYFAAKEQLVGALAERFTQQLLATIVHGVAACGAADWRGRLSAWAVHAVAGYLDAIRVHDIILYDAHAPTREGLVDNAIIDHLTGLLAHGASAGAWTIDDPRFTAAFLFNGLHGVVDDAVHAEPRVNRKRLSVRLERICFRAVGLRPPPAR
jgi:AcrR family transcriptional regulator